MPGLLLRRGPAARKRSNSEKVHSHSVRLGPRATAAGSRRRSVAPAFLQSISSQSGSGAGRVKMSSAADKPGAESSSYRPWWMESRERLLSSLPAFQSLSRVLEVNNGAPLPRWGPADVEEFVKEDPVHGPQVLKIREVAQAAAVGAGVGGLGSALFCLRYTKSPGGALLVLMVGSLASWALTEEVASLSKGLHNFNTVDAQVKFLEWWKQKQQG